MEFGRPMPVTSGYRCRKYDGDLRSLRGQEGTGVHTTGHAVDVHVVGEDAHRLLMLAGKHGMTGVGVSQRGAYESRFIHLDDAWRPEFPRPMVWSY